MSAPPITPRNVYNGTFCDSKFFGGTAAGCRAEPLNAGTNRFYRLTAHHDCL